LRGVEEFMKVGRAFRGVGSGRGVEFPNLGFAISGACGEMDSVRGDGDGDHRVLVPLKHALRLARCEILDK